MNEHVRVSLLSSSVRNGRKERAGDGETRRNHGQSVGADISAFARERSARQAMARSPSSRERHPLEVEDRGSPWREVPERYGPWQTCYDRFVRWRRDGTWEKLLSRIQTYSDAVGEVEWTVSVDSSVARAHQHAAAGARRQRSREDAKRGS